MILPGEPNLKAVHNERAKTTASYLNAAMGTCLGAGVVALSQPRSSASQDRPDPCRR